jgi:hypothetical protein
MKRREPEDPFLSPAEMAAEAGIALITWQRRYRNDPELDVTQLSLRRIGARRSRWHRVLEQQRQGERS